MLGWLRPLRHRGLHAGWLSWDDPEIVHADLVILRATRDYPARLDEFSDYPRGQSPNRGRWY